MKAVTKPGLSLCSGFHPVYVKFLESIKGKKLTDLTFREGGVSPLGGRMFDAYLGGIHIGSFSNRKIARDHAIKVIGQAEAILINRRCRR